MLFLGAFVGLSAAPEPQPMFAAAPQPEPVITEEPLLPLDDLDVPAYLTRDRRYYQ